MGLLDGILGNASKIDPAKAQGEFAASSRRANPWSTPIS
jgi:hypothetical protein